MSDCLEQIQRNMRLPMMVRLVPADHGEHGAHSPITLLERLGDFLEPAVVVIGKSSQQVGAAFGQHAADRSPVGKLCL